MKSLKFYWIWLPVVWALLIYVITAIQLPEKQVKKREIAFVVVSYKHEHAQKLVSAFKREAKKRGYEPIVSSSEDSRISEKEKVETLIDRKVEAIFLTTLDAEFIESALARAKKEKIPVIAIDRMINHAGVATSVVSDNMEIGRMAGDFLMNTGLPKPVRVVEVQGTVGVRPTVDRSLGFRKYVKENDGIVQVATLNGNYDPFQAEMEVERWLRKGVEFDAVFTHNDDIAFGVLRALEKAGVQNKTIVSVDGVSTIFPLIHAGEIGATIVQSPNEMITVGFEALGQYRSGKKLAEQYYSHSYLYMK